jgi:hypothetical protein
LSADGGEKLLDRAWGLIANAMAGTMDQRQAAQWREDFYRYRNRKEAAHGDRQDTEHDSA